MWTLRLWSLLMVSLDGWLQKRQWKTSEFMHPTALHAILSEVAFVDHCLIDFFDNPEAKCFLMPFAAGHHIVLLVVDLRPGISKQEQIRYYETLTTMSEPCLQGTCHFGMAFEQRNRG